VDIAQNSFSFNINKVQQAGFSVYVKGMLLTQEVKNDYTGIQGTH